MGKVNFGIIGCGGISNYFHIPELREIKEAEVVAVADVKPERARLTAERFNIKFWYSDHLKLLERSDVDAVIVATPHPTHAKLSVDAMEAGKHVIIQKPMCTKVEDAEAIVEASRKHSGLKVMVLPFVYFDTPAFDYVKNLLNEGVLGRICTARSRVAHGGPEKYQETVTRMFEEEKDCWFFNLERAHGGALLDLGVYAISQIVYLLGGVKRISAFVATLDKPAGVDDNDVVIMEMESGALAVVESSWTQITTLEGTSIYGTKGSAFLNYFNMPVAFYTQKESGWIVPTLAGEKEPQHTHRHFIKCILEDLKPIGSPEEGKHVVEIMEAAYESAKTGKTMMLKGLN
jgi:predicted dehydrogenase